MGHLLNSGQVGNIGSNSMKLIREDVINKWNKLGFLDGLNGYNKDNVAQLFENQASYLINEQTSASDSGSFETVVFPIVRRVFSKLLANDIVSVQAMNLPIGKLFYFVPEISTNKPGFDSATGGFNASTPATVDLYDQFYENEDGTRGLFDNSKGRRAMSPYGIIPGLLNNDGSFSAAVASLPVFKQTNGVAHRYVVGQLNSAQLSVVGGSLNGADGQPADTESFLAGLRFYLSGMTNTVNAALAANAGGLGLGNGGQTSTAQIYGLPCGTASGETLTRAKWMQESTNVPGTFGVGSFMGKMSGMTIPYRMISQKYGQGIVDASGNLMVEFDFGCPACPDCDTVTGRGYQNPGWGSAAVPVPPANISLFKLSETGLNQQIGLLTGAQTIVAQVVVYDTLELEDNMSEVTFRLDSVTVAVTERKLRATWSPELAQDVSAFHNIDAEAELTALLSEQVAAEIDREILKDLRNGAAWSLQWDYNGWRRANSGSGYNAYTQKDWNQTLITSINQLSAQIHKSTLRGGANWIVCSAEASAIFDDLEYFHVSNAAPEQDSYNMGIEKIGSLSGRYTVYRDPYFPAGTILIGHKGKSLLDTGYVYAPYVPLQLTPTMYNPFNFAPIKGIMTRYAKKMVNNRFYGKITVDGVQTFSINELR